jgi:hypothetical protein
MKPMNVSIKLRSHETKEVLEAANSLGISVDQVVSEMLTIGLDGVREWNEAQREHTKRSDNFRTVH